ncbi:MAG TPA: cytidine deaminase [Candidatus Gastranaerophilaceae bacterium]|nr:cytidine deaminase [Candidatus Gastranaerophilaceae bacterium]
MDYSQLLQKAKDASNKAYCPYSHFPVGACVLTKSGKTYSGCNVENASYGLSVCAERNAIANAAIAGDLDIVAIAVYAQKMENCLPCGACRQIIFEFQKDNEIDVIIQFGEGYKIYKINYLLPEAFSL